MDKHLRELIENMQRDIEFAQQQERNELQHAAKVAKETFDVFLEAGFTEEQALDLIVKFMQGGAE